MDWSIDPNTLSDRERLTWILKGCSYFLFHQTGRGMSQDAVIRILKERGPISQKTIQEEQKITPATASEIITKLERKGLVERTRDQKDRRKVVLSLTEEGKKYVFAPSLPKEHYYDSLSQKEIDTLLPILSKLFAGWMEDAEK